MAAASNKVWSLEGKGLKLDTAEDLEAYIADLKSLDDVEEVRLLGNTLGVGACKLLGEVLATKKSLKVRSSLYDLCFGRNALADSIPLV
jgi:Ran GTPase-activating protein 1